MDAIVPDKPGEPRLLDGNFLEKLSRAGLVDQEFPEFPVADEIEQLRAIGTERHFPNQPGRAAVDVGRRTVIDGAHRRTGMDVEQGESSRGSKPKLPPGVK